MKTQQPYRQRGESPFGSRGFSTPAGPSFLQVWKQMDPERRKQAAEAFCSGDNKTEQAAATAVLSAKLHLRPKMAAKLPPERRATYLASIAAPEEPLAGMLVRSWLFGQHRPMLTVFLDQLGIPHDNGTISAEAVAPPTAEALNAAIEKIRAAFDATDVHLYLLSLLASDAETWKNLELPQEAKSEQ